ncbi:MAG: ribosome assembly cofactor RimP [Marinifilaceae bacterium]|nr:ribosome assembly cofactor RimP [Marinifilaceae bacterium]
MRTKEEVLEAVNSLIDGKEIFLVDVKVSTSNVIEVCIDGLKGVNVERCIQVSRELESILDREKEDFELTVGSAGIGVPFKVDGQFYKNIGSEVDVKPVKGTPFKGVLVAFDGENVTLQVEEKVAVEGKKKKEIVVKQVILPRSEIKQIKDIIKF